MISGLSPRSPFIASSSRLKPTQQEIRLRVVNAILGLVVVGLLYFLVQAPGRTPEARQQQLRDLEGQQAALQARVANLRDLTARVQSATRTSQEFASGNFIGRANGFSTMVKNLEELATKSGLHPASINYDLKDESNELGWTGVSVKLSLEGEYTNMVRFINSVERTKIFWIIRSLDVAGNPESGLRLNLAADTYLLPSQN
jgi:type IV pilus assembly protein PilO